MVNVSNNFIDQYMMHDSINFAITSLMVSQLAPLESKPRRGLLLPANGLR